jgi:uncharacterized protein
MSRRIPTPIALLLMAGVLSGCGVEPPVDTAAVFDRARLLTVAERTSLATYHALLLTDHDIDYRVAIDNQTVDVDRYANAQYRALGVGDRSRSGRGLLLVVDPASDAVRLEVGGRLEGTFTDAFIGYLQRDQMVPFFREGRVADGILATTELLVAQLRQNTTSPADTVAPIDTFAAGAGASRAAELSAGRDASLRRGPDVAAAAAPNATVAAYLDAMAARNANPHLSLYSTDTQALLQRMPVTPAQMDNVAREGRRCSWEHARLSDDGQRAVVRASPQERACAPYFIVLEANQWRLDLATMYTSIRFGRNNAWRFEPATPTSYAFAFTDWQFDGNGFPVVR